MKTKKLQRIFEYSLGKYGEDAVLCAANTYLPNKDVVVFLIPTLEELCFSRINSLVETPDYFFQICSIQDFLMYNKHFEKVTVNPKYSDVFKEYFEDSDNIENIQQGTLNLIRERLNTSDNYATFKKSMTVTESDALDTIIEKIGKEGIVAVAPLSKETGISRLVYTNLLTKMDNTKMATMQNMGGKGTYIKITNQKLIKERGI